MSFIHRIISIARTNPILVVLAAAAVALAAIPLTNASHFGTGGQDVRFDVSQWTSAFVGGEYVGEQSAQTLGGTVTRATAYELTFIRIPVGDGSNVELRSATTGQVVVPGTPLSTGVDGPGGSLRNASFFITTPSLAHTGLYTLNAVGHTEVLGAILASPTRDMTVTADPAVVQHQPNSSMVMTIRTGVAGASIFGALVPANATADSNGDYTFVASMPQPGVYFVEAAKDLGGTPLPERTGGASFTVASDAAHLFQHDLVAPSSGEVGAPITVLASVTNDGTADGSGTITFLVNGAQRDSRTVFVAAGSTDQVNFTFTPTVAGTYSVSTQLGGSTLGPQTVSVTSGGLAVSASPSAIAVATWTNLTVGVSDSFGNPTTTAQVSLLRSDGTPATSDDFAGTLSTSGTGASGNGANGQYAFSVRASRTGEFLVRATAGSSSGAASLSVLSASPPPTCGNCTPPPPPPGGEGATFQIWDVRASALTTTSAPIRMGNVSNFGSATLTLSYDPSVVEVTNVANGDVPDSTLTWNVNASTGTVTLLLTRNATDTIAPASYDFARLTFRAAGPIGSTSPLDLAVVEAVDVDANSIPASATDGTFRSGILGDADGDGDVDGQDAQAIADAVVGRRSMASLALPNADVTGDGLVTGRDSMLVAQVAAGTRFGF